MRFSKSKFRFSLINQGIGFILTVLPQTRVAYHERIRFHLLKLGKGVCTDRS